MPTDSDSITIDVESPLMPNNTDVEEGAHAFVIHQDGQDLHRFETAAPWEDAEWIPKRRYDHGEVPPLNLQQTQVEQTTNGDSLQKVTLYATELADAEGDSDGDNDGDADNDSNSTASTHNEDTESESYRGHVIRFSDGKTIPAPGDTIHTTQEQNMGAAVEYLVTEHDLIDAIDIPHFPPRARTNCSINSESHHPNGDEMQSPYQLTGGYYLHTALNNQSKRSRTEDLAEEVGLSVEFFGDW